MWSLPSKSFICRTAGFPKTNHMYFWCAFKLKRSRMPNLLTFWRTHCDRHNHGSQHEQLCTKNLYCCDKRKLTKAILGDRRLNQCVRLGLQHPRAPSEQLKRGCSEFEWCRETFFFFNFCLAAASAVHLVFHLRFFFVLICKENCSVCTFEFRDEPDFVFGVLDLELWPVQKNCRKIRSFLRNHQNSLQPKVKGRCGTVRRTCATMLQNSVRETHTKVIWS